MTQAAAASTPYGITSSATSGSRPGPSLDRGDPRATLAQPGAADTLEARGAKMRGDPARARGGVTLMGALKWAGLGYLATLGRAAGHLAPAGAGGLQPRGGEVGYDPTLPPTEVPELGRRRLRLTDDPATAQLPQKTSYLPATRRDERRMMHRTYQLVVARHDEDVSWLGNLPKVWRLTVYNTGPHDLDESDSSVYEVVHMPNSRFGKEGLLFTHHILRNYGRSLADYTVFAQANPFEHNEFFNSLLWHPSLLLPVQTMSTKFSEAVPPKSVRDVHSPDPWFRSDRFSLFSMDSIYFKDCCVHSVGTIFREAFNLSEDVNLVAHMFDSIGLPGWVPEEQEIGSCSYGGMVGVSRAAIVQHPRKVYARMAERLEEHIQVGYIIERMWLMLFGGANYVDRDLDPFTVMGVGDTSDEEIVA